MVTKESLKVENYELKKDRALGFTLFIITLIAFLFTGITLRIEANCLADDLNQSQEQYESTFPREVTYKVNRFIEDCSYDGVTWIYRKTIYKNGTTINEDKFCTNPRLIVLNPINETRYVENELALYMLYSRINKDEVIEQKILGNANVLEGKTDE